MITKPTVLILGAGAATDYGFPLGRGLRDLVCSIVPQSTPAMIIKAAGYDPKQLEEFVITLSHSGYTSVDWFLEDHTEFTTIGKVAIAAALIPFEDPTKLFPPGAPNSHWYELLLNELITPQGSFHNNLLSIVTFNYDRSFEYYMFHVLKTRLNSEQLAIEALNSIKIIHVHGTLGGLPPLHPKGRLYSPKLKPDFIRTAAEQIIIVGEASKEAEEFVQARKLLNEAERIIFLGFGFHSKSVYRLGVFNEPWDEEHRQRMSVGGTSAGIPQHKWLHIRGHVLNEAFPSRRRSMNSVFEYLNEIAPLD